MRVPDHPRGKMKLRATPEDARAYVGNFLINARRLNELLDVEEELGELKQKVAGAVEILSQSEDTAAKQALAEISEQSGHRSRSVNAPLLSKVPPNDPDVTPFWY